jgi:hypothetical protein
MGIVRSVAAISPTTPGRPRRFALFFHCEPLIQAILAEQLSIILVKIVRGRTIHTGFIGWFEDVRRTVVA